MSTTYTSTIYESQAGGKFIHAGNQSVSGKIVFNGSVGDVLFLAKVPNNATIVDFSEYHTSGESAASISFGIDRGVLNGMGDYACLVNQGQLGTTNRWSFGRWPAGANFPPSISLSDLDPVIFSRLVGRVDGGSVTASTSVVFTLTYQMDGPYASGQGQGGGNVPHTGNGLITLDGAFLMTLDGAFIITLQ